MSEPDEAAVEAVARWSVAGEPGTYANPVHLLWPDDQDPDLPHRLTESHFAEAWPNTEDSIVAPAFAALVEAVRDAERLRNLAARFEGDRGRTFLVAGAEIAAMLRGDEA